MMSYRKNGKTLVFLPLALLALVAAAGGARAEGVAPAEDYAYAWQVETTRSADVYEMTLPLEVYRSVADARLRDLGVYDVDGQPVPRVIDAPQAELRSSERRLALVPLPIFRTRAGAQPDLNMRLLVQRDGTQTSVQLDASGQLTDAAPTETLPIAYVIDLRSAAVAIDRLELHWRDDGVPFIGHIDVEASPDLENWHRVGTGAISSLRHEDAHILRRTVALAGGDFEFLKLTWRDLPEGWSLASVEGITSVQSERVVRRSLVLDPVGRDEDDGGLIFDAGAALPVDQVDLRLPGDNTAISITLYSAATADAPWRRVHKGIFYHLRGGGEALANAPASIDGARARRWKVVIARGRADVPVQLELGWRPDRLAFVAQGSGPYRLVAGSGADVEAAFPQEQVFGDSAIFGFARDNDLIGAATLGPRTELGGPARLRFEPEPEPIDWSRWLLWIGLVGGVLLVAYLSLALGRQLKASDSTG